MEEPQHETQSPEPVPMIYSPLRDPQAAYSPVTPNQTNGNNLPEVSEPPPAPLAEPEDTQQANTTTPRRSTRTKKKTQRLIEEI